MVDDNSNDNSWKKMIYCYENYQMKLSILKLTRNFGQDSAIMSGIRFAKNDYIVIMDDDLQHNPIFIPVLLKKIKKRQKFVLLTLKEKNNPL